MRDWLTRTVLGQRTVQQQRVLEMASRLGSLHKSEREMLLAPMVAERLSFIRWCVQQGVMSDG